MRCSASSVAKCRQSFAYGLEAVESITAIDDETLVIVTKEPTRWPVDNLTMIVPKHIWKDITFEQAAIEAALKFKYKPRTVDGEPIEVPGVQNRITFTLKA